VSAGWFPDEHYRHRLRYWDGARWTSWVADADTAFIEERSVKRNFDFWAMTHPVWTAIAWAIGYGVAMTLAVRVAQGNWSGTVLLLNTLAGLLVLGPLIVGLTRRRLRKASVRPPRLS